MKLLQLSSHFSLKKTVLLEIDEKILYSPDNPCTVISDTFEIDIVKDVCNTL